MAVCVSFVGKKFGVRPPCRRFGLAGVLAQPDWMNFTTRRCQDTAYQSADKAAHSKEKLSRVPWNAPPGAPVSGMTPLLAAELGVKREEESSGIVSPGPDVQVVVPWLAWTMARRWTIKRLAK